MDDNSDRYGTGERIAAGKEPRERQNADRDADRVKTPKPQRHQRPRAMADHAHRFPGIEEAAHELHGSRLHSQLIGVGHAPGEKQGVVVIRVCLVDRHVDMEPVALVEVVPYCLPAEAWPLSRRGLGHRLPRVTHRRESAGA